MKKAHSTLLGSLLTVALCLSCVTPTPRVNGGISNCPEMSGMVKSRQYPDVFWVHGDSGNKPTLYAIDRSGKTIARFLVRGGFNEDWEDIAVDDAGNLYVGDIGNNSFQRKRLTVYQIPEPDPRKGSGE
ncbi:MAG: hypothetical protein JRC77_09980, partial [Deltaproteobacteria bacterium]|nr:hypothetical protein [Deltaproteobacteria bacterium]